MAKRLYGVTGESVKKRIIRRFSSLPSKQVKGSMDPSVNEGTAKGEQRTTRNNPPRAWNKDFDEAIQPPNTNTTLGAMHGTPGEGTSTVEGPTLHFLHRLVRESLELEMEMARLHHTMMKEQEMLEEGMREEKKGEKTRAKRKGKMPIALAGSASQPQIGDSGEEIALRKE